MAFQFRPTVKYKIKRDRNQSLYKQLSVKRLIESVKVDDFSLKIFFQYDYNLVEKKLSCFMLGNLLLFFFKFYYEIYLCSIYIMS